ncbi:unnamed protein product [Dovyalis caffra]|uniref:CBS domain-containing protein n=1 Tax=Dovyalis caffra TaxID=77055 RepID=A0AAV1R7L3_9ROSI|nr:unnamed protein product [Dovyalis caffra]
MQPPPPSLFVSKTPTSKRCRFFFSSARSPNRSSVTVALSTVANSVPARSGIYTVGDFMTKKEDLHVVKANTTVDDALEALVEKRITGFPVVDDDWKLAIRLFKSLPSLFFKYVAYNQGMLSTYSARACSQLVINSYQRGVEAETLIEHDW